MRTEQARPSARGAKHSGAKRNGARVAIALAIALAGCKGKIEKVRDGIVSASFEADVPRCKASVDVPRCLDDGAKALSGGTAFDGTNPDQASAAAVALLVSDGHASWLTGPTVWLAAAKSGKGAGGDALRLAIAKGLAATAESLGRELTADEDARRLMATVASSIPGACDTYALLGAAADESTLTPVRSPDNSACVQKDLARTDGPGGAYGYGLWRAAAAALALWKDAVRALDAGASLTTSAPREALDGYLKTVDAATAKIVLKQVDRPVGNRWSDGEHTAGSVAPMGGGPKK